MTYPRVPFEDHFNDLVWRQGQHIFIAGPNGTGKTTLAAKLLEKRAYVIGFGVKPKDKTLDHDYKDWYKVDRFDDIEPYMNRVLLWPRPKRRETVADWRKRQRKEFQRAFDILLKVGNWSVFIDELGYMSDPSFGGVGQEISMMHLVGRANGLSVLSLAQRPSFIPLSVLSNASHAYIARTLLATDVERLANLGGVDSAELAHELAALPERFDFIYQPTLEQGQAKIINSRK